MKIVGSYLQPTKDKKKDILVVDCVSKDNKPFKVYINNYLISKIIEMQSNGQK